MVTVTFDPESWVPLYTSG